MTIFLTGATGLLGSNMAACFLRAGHRVVALARHGSAERASRIIRAHPDYQKGLFSLSAFAVVEGDITERLCGAAETAVALKGHIDAFVHCAADVSFAGPWHSAQQRLLNVKGTENAVELCAFLETPVMAHLSTAYVDQQMRGLAPRTDYEKSKWDAELLFRRRARELRVRPIVARPSIVSGDRRNGFTPNFRGIYPFLKYGAQAAEKIRKTHALPYGLNAAGKVNMVPADFAAEVIMACLGHGCDGEVVNIINSEPWTVAGIIEAAAEFMGIRHCSVELRETQDPRDGPALDKALAADMFEYYNAQPELDVAGLEKIVATAGIEPLRNTNEWIAALLQWAFSRNWEEL